MFYFVNFSNDPKAQSYDQGKLFEKLVEKLVDKLGYKDIELREKISGKEYDIRAKAKLGNRQLIGEAKARRENQTTHVISSFIGSVDHKDLPSDTLGLFISISDLAPDAKDFLSKTRKRNRIETIIGQDILKKLVDFGYPTIQQVKNWAENQFEMRTGDTHLDDTPGLISVDKEGAGWFEHKLPAHPDRFIGRKTQIEDFVTFPP